LLTLARFQQTDSAAYRATLFLLEISRQALPRDDVSPE